MEGRLTVCNMSIEAGARAGMIAPDDTTFAYLAGRPFAPAGRGVGAAAGALARAAVRPRRGASTARSRSSADEIEPMVTWGTSPEDARPDHGPRARSGRSARHAAAARRDAARARLHGPRRRARRWPTCAIDRVFIGSCTNGRIEDLRSAAAVVARHARSPPASRPGSFPAPGWSRRRRKRRGSIASSTSAGFEWRYAGCSMCLGTNGDVVAPGQRCASTSNRNFVGRQGPGVAHASDEPDDGGRRGRDRPTDRRASTAGWRTP